MNSVQQRCQCGFVRDRITREVFRCFPASPQAVTYRAVLHGTANATSSQLISQIEQWTTEGGTITVQRVLMTIDGSCTVAISSITEKEECPSLEMESPSSPVHYNVISIITGGAASVVIALIVAVTVIVSLLLLRKHRAAIKLQHNRYYIL